MKKMIPVAALLGVMFGAPTNALAQDEAAPPPAPPVETELVFEREIFGYPTFTRINPFRPLLASDTGGPRYEQLRLSGIIVSETPGNSVAIFNMGAIVANVDGTFTATVDDSYAVKVGQTIGNVTVISIALDEVVVDVEEFGILDRKTVRPLNLLGGNQ